MTNIYISWWIKDNLHRHHLKLDVIKGGGGRGCCSFIAQTWVLNQFYPKAIQWALMCMMFGNDLLCIHDIVRMVHHFHFLWLWHQNPFVSCNWYIVSTCDANKCYWDHAFYPWYQYLHCIVDRWLILLIWVMHVYDVLIDLKDCCQNCDGLAKEVCLYFHACDVKV